MESTMESTQNMQNIFQRLGDLKSFFMFGQKIIPTFQKIIDFMQDTIPLLENVNNSIHESTNKIPKAALQLNSVTNATEIATTEILDIVDGMFTDIGTMGNSLNSLKSNLNKQKELIQKYDIAKVDRDCVDSMNNSNEIMLKDVQSLNDMTGKIQEGMTNITISLQVQDITAQQLSSVNHLMQSIQEKLASLLYDLSNKNSKEVPEFVVSDDSRNATFNPDARYDKNHTTQALADSLVNENASKTSQAEIDKLFSK
jgi:chemotaxis regulatin CheY-phosphate phosphatase CheZ